MSFADLPLALDSAEAWYQAFDTRLPARYVRIPTMEAAPNVHIFDFNDVWRLTLMSAGV